MNYLTYNTRKIIFLAFVLFLIDAFVFSIGLVWIFWLIIFLFWLPKSAILWCLKKSPKVPLTKSLIFGLLAICFYGVNTINNKIAKFRAEELIQAVERYYHEHCEYPAELKELVPTYVQKIPFAKYTLQVNGFGYNNYGNFTTLYFFDYSTFRRPTYIFQQKRWVSGGFD